MVGRAGTEYLDPRNWPQYRQPTRRQFLDLLKKGDKNALAFVAAGAPRIDARFAAKVAARDQPTLDFLAAHNLQGQQAQATATPAAAQDPAALAAQQQGVAAQQQAYIEALRRLAGA